MNSVRLLISAIAVVGANALVLSPIAGDVAASFAGRSAPDVMIASALYGAATTLSALFIAPTADVIGLRRALAFALAGLAVSLGMSAAAISLPMLVAAQAFAGVAAGVALPAIYGLSRDIAPAGRESETLGKVLTGWTLSLVIGVFLSAMLADIAHWRSVYGVLAVVCGAIWLGLRAAAIGASGAARPAASPLQALRVPGVAPILLSVAAYMVAFYGLYAYLGAHLTSTLGLSTAGAGAVALSYGAGFGAIAPLARLIDRYGADRAGPIVFAALVAIYAMLAAGAASSLAILGLALLWGGANHLGLNILVGRLNGLSREGGSAVLGLYGAVTYAAMFVGTAAFRPVYEAFGFAVIAGLSAICVSPALLLSLSGRGRAVKES